jgi:hypothetical protein
MTHNIEAATFRRTLGAPSEAGLIPRGADAASIQPNARRRFILAISSARPPAKSPRPAAPSTRGL